MDLDFWRLVADYAAIGLAIASFFYAHWRTQRNATQADMKALKDENSSLRDRMRAVEVSFQHLPKADAFATLNERLGALHGDLQHMLGEFTGWKQEMKTMRGNVQLLVDNELRSSRS
jgi:hypothetical protein